MVKLEEVVMILDLHSDGLSISAIARVTGLDRKTVAKYIARGLEAPAYKPREPRPTLVGPFADYLAQRVAAWPELSARRRLHEIQERGYTGSYTSLKDYLRTVRPKAAAAFERRFETPPGRQAQVDFAQFRTRFEDDPGTERIIWLFSLVLGHSRFLWARFVARQDLSTVLRCHMEAFAALGGVPGEILYDRMKTAVVGEGDERGIVYNRTLLEMATHYGYLPKACRPYRAKTKGKVERPFRYVRQDFFLGRSFRDMDDLNRQLRCWLDDVANARVHATTGRVVAEHFVEEQPALKPLPAGALNAVLALDRRITRDGMVSVGGNLYSVPDGIGRRVVEVHSLANEIRIFNEGALLAIHPVLDGKNQRRVADGHRRARAHNPPPQPRSTVVTTRPLAIYDAVARRLASEGIAA